MGRTRVDYFATPLWSTSLAVADALHVSHAWVLHEVQPNRSEADRISITFNFVVAS